MTDPNQNPAWRSYLMPGTDVLRTLAELTEPAAVAIFERIVSADAEASLRRATDRPRTLDLAHLNDIHERLFGEVYPFAGQLRYVDIAKTGQSGEPFLHHRWIETYLAAVTEQLRREENLTAVTDPGQWADRAAYYWAAYLHAHPYREGNGRAIRVWLGDFGAAAGHQLDWTRASAAHTVHVAVAALAGDVEPMRALLTVVAGGTVGVDRELAALNDLHALQRAQAWARTGIMFGTHGERAQIAARLEELQSRIGAVQLYLALHPNRATSTGQPPADRWRGLAAATNPALTTDPNWPALASDLDAAAGDGVDVATELSRLVAGCEPANPAAAQSAPDAAATGRSAPRAGSARTAPAPPRPHELATAAGYSRPPAHGPRR